MEQYHLTDKPEGIEQEAVDKADAQQSLRDRKDVQDSADNRPGTFRYSDASLGGEVRTSSAGDGIYSEARADVHRRDGTSETVGTARYSVADGEAQVYPRSFTAPNYGTEDALLHEVGDQARLQGADKIKGWAPDNEPDVAQRWSKHGFQPTAREPGAAGVWMEKKL